MNVEKSTRGRVSSAASCFRVSSTTRCPPAKGTSVLAPAERRLRDRDRVAVLAHVGDLGEVLFDVLVVEDRLAEVPLSDAHVPVPGVNGLGISGGHGRFPLPRST